VQPPLDIAALGNPPSYYVSVFIYCWTVGSAILVSGGDYDFGLEFRFRVMSSGRCSVDLRACLAAAGYWSDDGALIGGTNEQTPVFFDLIVFFTVFQTYQQHNASAHHPDKWQRRIYRKFVRRQDTWLHTESFFHSTCASCTEEQQRHPERSSSGPQPIAPELIAFHPVELTPGCPCARRRIRAAPSSQVHRRALLSCSSAFAGASSSVVAHLIASPRCPVAGWLW